MMVCNSPSFVFIAIPKTGTRTIYDFLEKKYNVTLVEDHLVIVPASFRDRYTFTVVRNPYDRACSAWWSTCMRGKDRYGFINAFKKHGLPNTLLSFLTIVRKNYFGGKCMPAKGQYEYLSCNRIDYILRFEMLNNDFNHLEFLQNDVVLNGINETTYITENNPAIRPDWTELVDSESIKLINEIYFDDFDLLDYEKLS